MYVQLVEVVVWINGFNAEYGIRKRNRHWSSDPKKGIPLIKLFEAAMITRYSNILILSDIHGAIGESFSILI